MEKKQRKKPLPRKVVAKKANPTSNGVETGSMLDNLLSSVEKSRTGLSQINKMHEEQKKIAEEEERKKILEDQEFQSYVDSRLQLLHKNEGLTHIEFEPTTKSFMRIIRTTAEEQGFVYVVDNDGERFAVVYKAEHAPQQESKEFKESKESAPKKRKRNELPINLQVLQEKKRDLRTIEEIEQDLKK